MQLAPPYPRGRAFASLYSQVAGVRAVIFLALPARPADSLLVTRSTLDNYNHGPYEADSPQVHWRQGAP